MWRPADLVAFFQDEFTEKTFANWRAARIGPPFVKVGSRVFYRPEAVRQWTEQCETTTAPLKELGTPLASCREEPGR